MVLALLTLVIVPTQSVGAVPDAPTCYDFRTQQTVTATKWLDAPGTLLGTNKRDVLVGSTGADIIKGLSGNDVICTTPDGANDLDIDTVDGGPGDDSIYGIAHADGGTGGDYIYVFWTGSTVNGGAGNDRIVAVSGAKANGGSGSDIVVGLNAGELWGGTGSDQVGSIISGGYTKMDCGSGTDSYAEDGAATIRRCENTTSTCVFSFAWDWLYNAGTSGRTSIQESDLAIQC
jgi:hypothetical protein